MPGARGFTDLVFRQKARQWSKDFYQLTQRDPFRLDRRLVTQINDSSESVMANVAEGFGRGTQAEFVTFLGYSIGSLNETQSHLCAAYDRGHISRDEFADLFDRGTRIRKMIVGFIQSMVKPRSGVKHMRQVPRFSDEVWELYERVTGKPRPEFFRQQDGTGQRAESD